MKFISIRFFQHSIYVFIATTPTNSQIDNMMFLDRTNNVNNNVTDNTNPSSQSPEIISIRYS